MIEKIALLLHGPFAGHAYPQIFAALRRSKLWQAKGLMVVAVVYVTDLEKTRTLLEGLHIPAQKVRLLPVKDVVNPGFFNLNRQLVSVRAGLDVIPADHYVIKLRNDQWVNFNRLLPWMERTGSNRLMTTNCFTRKDRLYHPSDMFLCGMQPVLQSYYSCPLDERTHETNTFEMRMRVMQGEPFEQILCTPEMELCKSYLDRQGWNRLNTPEDSYAAIKRYFQLVNSWEIRLHWNKKRTPLKPAGSLIYPQYFDAAPFEGAPVEHAACYHRDDFDGRRTLRDRFYILQSRFLWSCWEGNSNHFRIRWFLKHCVRMLVIVFVNLLPFFLGKRLAHIAYAPSLKQEGKRLLKKTPAYSFYRRWKYSPETPS